MYIQHSSDMLVEWNCQVCDILQYGFLTERTVSEQQITPKGQGLVSGSYLGVFHLSVYGHWHAAATLL